MSAVVMAGTAVAALAGAAIATGGGALASDGPPASVAQEPGVLSIPRVAAYTRSVRLRRRTVLAAWSVATGGADVSGVTTCIGFPRGFRISYLPVNRPPNVRVSQGARKACVPVGTIYANSSSEFLVEGYAPRTVGTYRVTATASGADVATARKTVNLRILRRCAERQCPGFPGSSGG